MNNRQDRLLFLTCLFVASLIISNIVAARLIKTGFFVFGQEVVVPGAVFCYAITFLLTDAIGELWGEQEANRAVKYGVVSQMFAASLIFLTGILPTFSHLKSAYDTILGQNAAFVVSSLCAYWVSQHVDVYIFHWLKRKTNNRRKWLRNNISTIVSQFLDTAIFISIAFGIGYGWLFDPGMHRTLFVMLAAQYVLKVALALLDTPLFYLLTRNRRPPPK